ncbi:deoxyguanosinetriphosphate triphosphohydrolase [Parapedobacter sp.]
MNWRQLLSAKRWGYESRPIDDQHDARSEFQRDYDRLIFSSPFRRLQNKTQVFPLPGSVFVHNRLTHSLEVASVGRSLGRIFYNETRKSVPAIDAEVPYLQEVGNIVSAACLSHDLGNPAFGHSGEAAISSYFTDGGGQIFKDRVSPEEWADLTHFEGNANALRILTHAFSGKDEHGFALTYSTLGAIVKYPCASIDGHDKLVHHRKKYGFFQSEQPAFQKIARELGLLSENGQQIGYKRHPLVYLVEAADDICYNIIDLEDAHRLGILSYEEVARLLLPICGDDQLNARLEVLGDSDSRISLLRAKAINILIVACANAFIQHEEAILQGGFDKPLMDALASDLVDGMRAIERVSIEKIYNAQSVVQIEVAGYKVMNGLLEEFIPAYLSERKTKYHSKLLALMPKQFHTNQETTYARVRSVLDFVSGMTDLYAVELFRKIKGISFPSLD